MKIKQLAFLMALAVAAAGASAQTKLGGGDFGPLDPTEVGSDSIDISQYNAFDDKWTFSLSSTTTLSEYALTFDISQWSNLSGTQLTLRDSFGDSLGSIKFDGTAPKSFLFGDFGAGSYYYEVTGHLGRGATNGGYEISSFASAVPEPGNASLIAAGLGLLGFVSRRRRSR